ncbi:MAG: hypothetical protein V4508_15705, partial [Pseudomonadota bacterium]
MRLYPILSLVLGVGLCELAGAQAYVVEDRPTGWPAAQAQDCRTVIGTYQDPNTVTWEHVEQRDGVSSKRGMSWYAAWPGFHLPSAGLNFGDSRSYTFSIAFDDTEALVVTYMASGATVATLRIPNDKWSCEKDGLHLTTGERSGVISDLIPNHGTSSTVLTLNRVDDQLYMKMAYSADITYLHILPTKN